MRHIYDKITMPQMDWTVYSYQDRLNETIHAKIQRLERPSMSSIYQPSQSLYSRLSNRYQTFWLNALNCSEKQKCPLKLNFQSQKIVLFSSFLTFQREPSQWLWRQWGPRQQCVWRWSEGDGDWGGEGEHRSRRRRPFPGLVTDGQLRSLGKTPQDLD